MTAVANFSPDRVRNLPVEQQEQALEIQLDRARTALALALEASDVHMVAQIKGGTAVMEKLSKELRLSKECQLDAAEMVRRSEYALGKAIRQGQEDGTVASRHMSGGPRKDYVRHGRVVRVDRDGASIAISPGEFLAAGTTTVETYVMADAGEEKFEEALAGAKAEQNLSRANVVRKLASIPAGVGSTSRPKSRINSARVLESTAAALEGAAYSIQLIEPDQLDQESAETQLDSLTESIKALSKAVKKIKESIHE